MSDASTPVAASASTTLSLHDFFATSQERINMLPVLFNQSHTVSSARTIELLGLRLGREEYALEIKHVQEIMKVPFITPVPNVLPHTLGIISLRGTIVPVADTRQLFALGQGQVTRASRILVLGGDGAPVGFLVDSVSNVVRLDKDSIEPKPRGVAMEAVELIAGVGRVQERMVIVVDVVALLQATLSLV